MLGMIGGERRRGWQWMTKLDGITDSMDMNLSKFQEIVEDREVWCDAVYGSQRARHTLVTKQQRETQIGKLGFLFVFFFPT